MLPLGSGCPSTSVDPASGVNTSWVLCDTVASDRCAKVRRTDTWLLSVSCDAFAVSVRVPLRVADHEFTPFGAVYTHLKFAYVSRNAKLGAGSGSLMLTVPVRSTE